MSNALKMMPDFTKMRAIGKFDDSLSTVPIYYFGCWSMMYNVELCHHGVMELLYLPHQDSEWDRKWSTVQNWEYMAEQNLATCKRYLTPLSVRRDALWLTSHQYPPTDSALVRLMCTTAELLTACSGEQLGCTTPSFLAPARFGFPTTYFRGDLDSMFYVFWYLGGTPVELDYVPTRDTDFAYVTTGYNGTVHVSRLECENAEEAESESSHSSRYSAREEVVSYFKSFFEGQRKFKMHVGDMLILKNASFAVDLPSQVRVRESGMLCWSLLPSGQSQRSTYPKLTFPVREEFHALRTVESCVIDSADAKKLYQKEQRQVAGFYKQHGTDTSYIFSVQDMERLRVLPDCYNVEDLQNAVLRNENVHDVSKERFWQVSQDDAKKIDHIRSRLLKFASEDLVCKEGKMRFYQRGAQSSPIPDVVDRNDVNGKDCGHEIGDEFMEDEEYSFTSTE